MKLTINLDDALLDRVVAITGASTKTEAITMALREIDRKARLIEALKGGLGATTSELKSMFDEASAPERFRTTGSWEPPARVAETPTPYNVTANP